MKIRPDICWKLENNNIDPDIFALLHGIRAKGSLKQAAEDAGLSYRHAWGILKALGEKLKSPLTRMERGRGASLTEVGENLLWAEELARTRLAGELQVLAGDINRQLAEFLHEARSGKLRINASHGLAIAHLHTLLQESTKLIVDFHFRGSLESLRELANSRCDIAGFHFPAGPIGKKLAPHYRQWLDRERHLLFKFATRKQGLMIKPGNPRKITRLQDLTKRSVRFINRQEESGTRTILDALLSEQKIDKTRIKGYHDEEFTHVAVAALIASGVADAGFGIEAAARKFGLQFIPIVSETYVFAIDSSIQETLVDEFIRTVRSRKIKSLVNALPGYDVRDAGRKMDIEDLFAS